MDKMPKEPIENPFDKVTAEQLNDNYALIAHLFAKPEAAIYNKLVGRENYIIVGGWGSGKSMLLKYLGLETQIEDVGVRNVRKLDFIGVYIKAGRGPFRPFLKPGGKFKEGGENLFGHYLNLLIMEKVVAVLLYARDKGVFSICAEAENRLYERIVSKFSFIRSEQSPIALGSPSGMGPSALQGLRDGVAGYRREIESFLNTRDLEENLSYEDRLSIRPTDIKTFLDEVVRDIKETIGYVSKKRLYILLDECEQFSKGQQKVINTIIKQRLTTLVFKLATRPPDIQTAETIDLGVGITDRECKRLYLDKVYDPTSASFRKLCEEVAEKRLENSKYPILSMRKILGKFTVEDEIGREAIESYLKKTYTSKARIKDKHKFKTVYKDFKTAATFQILSGKRIKKKYVGFNAFVTLSSGLMLHFLELCRETFNHSIAKKYIYRNEGDEIAFKETPLSCEIQNKAVENISESFYNDVGGRAESLKEAPIEMEFGDKIKYIVSVLGGIFREKLMSFNEPEAARIEIPQGLSALDVSEENPIGQIFHTSIAISVFQQGRPYMPKRIGGIRPPTYILNRLLAPYLNISPNPRWRTKILVDTFNKILKVSADEFKKEVLGRKTKKQKKTYKLDKKQGVTRLEQPTLPFVHTNENMPILTYLGNKVKNQPLRGKKLLLLLHFLSDLIPFVDSCKKIGLAPANAVILYKEYKYPNALEIKHYLEAEGYGVSSVWEAKTVLQGLEGEKIIIVEDGGHIVPLLHRDFQRLAKFTLGAVEQTTRGIRNDEEINELLFPVISIPGSDLKNTFEPPHVARAVVNNIQKLLANKTFSAKKALVIGFGSIGQQVALQVRDTLKMQVSIYDVDDNKLVEARQNGFETEEALKSGVKGKYLIIGTTGETVIGRSEVLSMDHNVNLISASSEQWEFCISELDALSSEKPELFDSNKEKIGTKYKLRNSENDVNLIADGYPVNFWKTESMPNEVSDLIMSLLFVSMIEIATNRSLNRGIDCNITNKLSKDYELGKIYLEYHQ